MRSFGKALAILITLALAGCGQHTVTGPAGSGNLRFGGGGSAPTSTARGAHHPFVGGIASANPWQVESANVQGNPTAPGLVSTTPIGSPTWKPVDFHFVSAPIGTAGDGYAEFVTTAEALLPPPNHVFNPDLGIGPGAPHSPPYGSEIAAGAASAGFVQSHRFTVAQFSNGAAVYCAWMIVAGPAFTGSSPDFASGPIIPNSLFPIHVAGTTYRNGQVWDPFLGTFDVPSLTSLSTPFAVDGSSHFPVFFGDNMDFAPPNTNANGSYSYKVRMF